MLSMLHHAASLYHSFTHLHHSWQDAHWEMNTNVFNRAIETVEHLRLKLPEHLQKPRVAIVCGSGLGGLADVVNKDDNGGKNEKTVWDYKDVPNFPLSTVPGHEGKLIFATLGPRNVPVVLLVGRAHFYEGHEMATVTFATRVCKVLGCETILLTNAAGGLNPDYAVGDIILLNDHLNLAGLTGYHPLRGPNADDFGTRFPPLSDAYDIQLRQLAHKAWRELRAERAAQAANQAAEGAAEVAEPAAGGAADAPSSTERRLHEGVYAFVAGPSYETRAECRMLRQLGADVVGMSTVPEIVVARHSGLRVLAFSLVTNKAVLEPTVRGDERELEGMGREELDAYLSVGRADHSEVLEAGKQAAIDMQGLVARVVGEL